MHNTFKFLEFELETRCTMDQKIVGLDHVTDLEFFQMGKKCVGYEFINM